MRNRLTVFVAILLLLPVVVKSAWAQGSGAIEGQVFDGSGDGGPLQGLPVTLSAFAGPEAESSFETTTDEEGNFRFGGLKTEGYAYQFEVEYAGVQYPSEVMAFPEGENLISVPFTVFEATSSDEYLSVQRAHVIFDFEPGIIRVQEVQIFFNAGNATYVGPTGEEGETTVQFAMPEGATAVQLVEGLMECCVVETDTGLASTLPVFPGVKQFVFTYELHPHARAYDLVRRTVYPTQSLDVLVADIGVDVTADGLSGGEETLSLQGGDYLHLAGENLSAGEDISLHFANLPLETAPAQPPGNGTPLLTWIVMGVIIAGAGAALAYPFLHRSKETP
jgi:hypothetical protein